MPLLVPYSEAMRLGMGFNTFTQQLCIDGAMTVSRSAQGQSAGPLVVNNPSQTVTYSSRIVEKLSDIVETLNISYSAAIKKGTIVVSGNSDTIDEDKIKSSDLNAIVSVKVQNQMTLLSEKSEFEHIEGIEPNSSRFNDVFGDGYISGFIEGGEFTGVVSVRVLERKAARISEVASKLKKSLGKGMRSPRADSFTLDRTDISESGAGEARYALSDSETTVSVSWNGGGQVKAKNKAWNIDTMFEAAAAFPANVAASPQRTWAIVTKYSNSRAYVIWEQSKIRVFTPLEYDNVAGFSAELFENYFQYKQLVKLVQAIIADPEQYEVQKVRDRLKTQPIPLDLSTLVAVRAALRNEMNKLVQAVDVLTRDPGILKRAQDSLKKPNNKFITDFLLSAREGTFSAPSDTNNIILQNLISPAVAPNSDHASQNTHSSDSTSSGADKNSPSATMSARSMATVSSRDKSNDLEIPAARLTPAQKLYFDFDSLIAPEIWMQAIPKLKDPHHSIIGETVVEKPTTVVSDPIPPPPTAEEEKTMLKNGLAGGNDTKGPGTTPLPRVETSFAQDLLVPAETLEMVHKFGSSRRAEIWKILHHPSVFDSRAARASYIKNLPRMTKYGLSELAGDPDGSKDTQTKLFNFLEAVADDPFLEALIEVRACYNDTQITYVMTAQKRNDGHTQSFEDRGLGDKKNHTLVKVSLQGKSVHSVTFKSAKVPNYDRPVITSITINEQTVAAPNTNLKDEISTTVHQPSTDRTWTLFSFWGVLSHDDLAFHRLGVVWREEKA